MIRQSPIAGSWYPADPKNLEETIRQLFLDKEFGPGVDPKSNRGACDRELVGLVTPHAGYFYSGSIAAHSYAHLFSHYPQIHTAIILGPNHQFGYPEISIFPEGEWALPMGEVPIDEELLEYAKSYRDEEFHEIVQFEGESQKFEHSIEIQVPFLQYLYGDNFTIFPICFGNQEFQRTGKVISNFIFDLLEEFSDRKIAIIASSDLSHEPDINLLESRDQRMLNLLQNNDLEEAIKLRDQGMTMCGYGPVFTLADLTRKFGNPRNQILSYAHSSKIRPYHKGPYTVGYPSMAFEY